MLQAGNTGTINAGIQNDSIFATGAVGEMACLAATGSDTINVGNATIGQTILGGNDSADNADSILAGRAADLVFGHGGEDCSIARMGEDTLIGGFGNDSIWSLGALRRSRVRQRR